MDFDVYQMMLWNFDEKEAWLEFEHVAKVLTIFEARDEHRLSVDMKMWLIYDTKFELLTHRLYEFEEHKPDQKYWKLFYYFHGKVVEWTEERAQFFRSTKVHDMLQEDRVDDKQDTSIKDLFTPQVDPPIEYKVENKEEQLEGINLQSNEAWKHQDNHMVTSFMGP